MKNRHLLLTGIATVGVFSLGYVTGRLAEARGAGDDSSSSAAAASSSTRHAAHRDEDAAAHDRAATKTRHRSATTDTAPGADKGFSRRVLAMMASGELGVSGVQIDAVRLLPGEKVKDFLGLTDEQMATMKQMGRDRLKARQDHERALATDMRTTGDGVEVDLPADPAFAEREAAAFTEEIRREFGPDVAAVLQTSITQAYGEFANRRHVRYSLLPNPNTIPDDAPPEIRQKMEGIRAFKVAVNQNADGTYMTDDQGMILGGAQSSSGSIDTGSADPDAWMPRYHYLLPDGGRLLLDPK